MTGGFTDKGLAALGSLPPLDQPGERFRYNTGATVAGILIERVTGARSLRCRASACSSRSA